MQVSDDARVGTELAGYRIESLLGWGGMSVVYLAEDLRLKRRVALKLLAASLAEDESFRERFLRESELAASIDHPNIVPIYEAGDAEGLLFIAMRYVEGSDLREKLRSGPLDPTDATGILGQLASALDAAHARGLVHRDVKPSNVLLDTGARPDGSDHVYLSDFGLTRSVSEQTGTGADGHLLGTIDYVAPEQITGEQVDARADVYSLGCGLYECLVGQPPFRRESEIAVVFAHLDTEPPAPSSLRQGLPAALDGVIARALAKDPAERYPSCRELARAVLAVAVDDANRRLVDVASRAAAGRSGLSNVEEELAGSVIDLQLAREQARALAGPDTPARVAAEGICPFKGLASFEPVDADYFYGRERLVAELVARLVGAGFLGIVGPSGSGKSSVLRAGLLPALAGGVLPGSEAWRRLLLRPGERPLEELRRVLVSGARDPLAEALDTLPGDARLLLAVDQLEELFTACRSGAERAAFADALASAAADPEGRAVVVAALRADFYGRFAELPALAELLGANHVLVGPMQASELRRAVELPAGRVGLRVERELADALVDDVEGEPGALPLLSTALLELWQTRNDNSLTLAAYRESGGVHGAVARLAEGTYARIAEGQKPLVRALLLRLVGEDEGDLPVRRRASLAELDVERDEDAADVLAVLAGSRLVSVGEGSVEVAHEALLSEWPRLRGWIEEDTEGRRLRRHLTRAAIEWDGAGRDPGELYRGARLVATLDWTAEHSSDLNELERAFVAQSREVAEQEARRAQRTNRRLRALLAGVAALLAAAVAGGIFAAVQRSEARDAATAAHDAETAQLAQRLGAQALVEADLDLSLLLARQAVALDDTPQTRGNLLAALQRAPEALAVMHGGSDSGTLRGVDVSPDGTTLAVADFFEGLLLFDTRTFEQKGLVDAPGATTVAYSPDGETLVLGGGFLRLINAETRRPLVEVPVALVSRVEFTGDGSRLVVVESDGEGSSARITIRDASTLKPIGTPIRPEGFSGSFISEFWTDPSAALTSDGRSLVTASPLGELAWWDLESRATTRTLEIGDGYRALALSHDGRTVAVGADRGIRLIDSRTGEVREAIGALASDPLSLLFSPDGTALVSTTRDGAVTLWDAGTATPLQAFHGHSRSVPQAVFSPNGETLYAVGHDGAAIAWDVSGDRRLGRPFRFTHDRGFHEWPDWHPAGFSPDGRLLAVGLKEDGIDLWNADELRPAGAPLRGILGEIKALAFSPDGKTLAAVATDGGRLSIWDTASRSLRHGPLTVGSYALGVAISADGSMLATAGAEGVELYDLATGDYLRHLGDERSAGAVAFSPTEPRIAVVYEGTDGGDAEIWDVARGSRLVKIDLDGGDPTYFLGWAVAFSPDGRLVATPGLGRVVQLWDASTGELVREVEHNVGTAVHSLEFSPDGTVLAISGGDSFASLWDVATGAQLGPRLTAGGRAAELDISPDGRHLVMAHADGKGAVWEIDPKAWAERACAVANRTLTAEEWDEFLPGRPYEPACR